MDMNYGTTRRCLERWWTAAPRRWARAGGLLALTLLCAAVVLAIPGCGGGDSGGGGPKAKHGGGGGDDDSDTGGKGLKSRNKGGDDDSDSGGKGAGKAKGGPPPAAPPPGGSSGGPPGSPPGGAPGGAPPAPAAPTAPTDLALGVSDSPTRARNPFQPLDKPLKKAPVQTTAQVTARQLLAPFRPQLILPPSEKAVAATAVEPQDLRVAGFNREGKAVLEQNDQNWTVWPGQRIVINFNGQQEVVVISVSPDGVILQDPKTKQLYHAPTNRARGGGGNQ
jgi:hypothetical protein